MVGISIVLIPSHHARVIICLSGYLVSLPGCLCPRVCMHIPVRVNVFYTVELRDLRSTR